MPERIEVLTEGEVTVVQFKDEKILDEANIQQIGEELYALVEDGSKQKLLVNFENVAFLSSATLGKLISLNKRAGKVGTALKFCSIRPDLLQVFEMTGLTRVFDIHDDQASALDAFN